METKKCEICGRELPISEFSKSYKHRCKDCVAKMTKEKRKNSHIKTKSSLYDLYKETQKPNKEVITITIDKRKGMIVDYQRDDEPKKNWKDCNILECISINAAANVLKSLTEASVLVARSLTNVQEIQEVLNDKFYNI